MLPPGYPNHRTGGGLYAVPEPDGLDDLRKAARVLGERTERLGDVDGAVAALEQVGAAVRRLFGSGAIKELVEAHRNGGSVEVDYDTTLGVVSVRGQEPPLG